MNIVRMLMENLALGSTTLRFPRFPATPTGYRGSVISDAAQCVGCGTCAYVCTSGAIEVQHHALDYEWIYDAAKCTFCGRCADYCPLHLLTMSAMRPDAYHATGDLRHVERLPYPLCAECGAVYEPVNQLLLEKAFGELSSHISASSRLCPKCRSAHCAEEMLTATGVHS